MTDPLQSAVNNESSKQRNTFKNERASIYTAGFQETLPWYFKKEWIRLGLTLIFALLGLLLSYGNGFHLTVFMDTFVNILLVLSALIQPIFFLFK